MVQRLAGSGLLFVVILVTVTAIDGTLLPIDATAVEVALSKGRFTIPGTLNFPMLHDITGLAAMIGAFITPYIVYRQIEVMEALVTVHGSNINHRQPLIDWADIEEASARANEGFRRIGSAAVSWTILAIAGWLSFLLLRYVQAHGPLTAVRPAGVNPDVWYLAVHGGWWANARVHPSGALLLFVAGVILFYYLVKQLLMGLVFTNWVKQITAADFGVFPNLNLNNDGYWGMRNMRSLFQWTYASALLNLSLSLLVAALWLPVGVFTVSISVFIIAADGLFIVFPTLATLRAVVAERKAYVAHLWEGSGQAVSREIDEIWQRPMLPFRLRESFAAVSVYFLMPTAAAILGSHFGR